MDHIVSVSGDERARGMLAPDTARSALGALTEHGCVLLRGAFALELIDGLYREFLERYGALDAAGMAERAASPPPNRFLEVGTARYEITLAMQGAFANPQFFANPLLTRFLLPLLGTDMRLSGLTTVVSHPGAGQQHTHRDHPHLFTEQQTGPGLPTYAINVSLPLIDVDLQIGPTGVWLGSQRWPQQQEAPAQAMTALAVQRGDCVLIDYRTLHAGLPNRSTRVRPILYLVYARTWFYDEVNHVARRSLDMSLEQYEALPAYARPLLQRAYSQAIRARWHEAGD